MKITRRAALLGDTGGIIGGLPLVGRRSPTYLGQIARLKHPFMDINHDTYEPYQVSGGEVFHEYIFPDAPECSCVLVAYPMGGFGAFKLDQVILEV
jgi:hypothetical protein